MTGRRSDKGPARRRPIRRSPRALVYRDAAERNWSIYGRWLVWFRKENQR